MILVTGGAGYIGSHICVELLLTGHNVVLLDNYANSSSKSHKRIEQMTGSKVLFTEGDVRDKALLRKLFLEYEITSVIHLAGLKSVPESIKTPLEYYNNNVVGSLSLFEVMLEFDCKRLVFSSSATVYGNPLTVPILENAPLNPLNPY